MLLNDPVICNRRFSHFVPILFMVDSSVTNHLPWVASLSALDVTLLYVRVIFILAKTSSYEIPNAYKYGSGRA